MSESQVRLESFSFFRIASVLHHAVCITTMQIKLGVDSRRGPMRATANCEKFFFDVNLRVKRGKIQKTTTGKNVPDFEISDT